MDEVRRLGGESAAKIVDMTKRGAHAQLPGVAALDLTSRAERLVKQLEAA